MGSKPFSLNSQDIKKIAKGAGIAAGSSALIQLSTFLSTGVAFDPKLWSVAILSVAINTAIKYVQDN